MSGYPSEIATPPVAANLNAEFERVGLTNEFVARHVGVSERTLRRWRKGRIPAWHDLLKVADVFGREAHWFYIERDEADLARIAACQEVAA